MPAFKDKNKPYQPHKKSRHVHGTYGQRVEISLTRKGKVKPPVKSNVRRISVLARAHKLGVLDGGLGNSGGRCLLTHHAYPIFRPRFLPTRAGLVESRVLAVTPFLKGAGGATDHRGMGEVRRRASGDALSSLKWRRQANARTAVPRNPAPHCSSRCAVKIYVCVYMSDHGYAGSQS